MPNGMAKSETKSYKVVLLVIQFIGVFCCTSADQKKTWLKMLLTKTSFD